MLYKIGKPSGKDAEERESLTNKNKTRVGIGDKKVLTKPSYGLPSSLGASDHGRKNIDDPQVKLKQLKSSPRSSELEMPVGMQQLVRQMTNIIVDKKHPLKNENLQRNGSCSAKNSDNNKNKSYEKLSRSNDASENKNSTERTKAQKGDFPKKFLSFKSKSYINELPERKVDNKILSTTVKGKKNGDLEMKTWDEQKGESAERKYLGSSKKEISKSQSLVGPVTKKSLRRSEIPLLKTRQKRAELVALLIQKPVKENDSKTSVDLSHNIKDPSADDFIVTSEFEAISKSNENSAQPDDSGEVNNLRSVRREVPETSEYPLTPSNVSLDLKTSELKVAKASKAKTLDLERVKTSSFTVLRAEGDSFNRLESFHQQNLTAKETARAEIAVKASKIVFMTSKASFSSLNSRKNFSVDKGNKLYLRKTKRRNNESQESNFQKKSPKASEAPYLETGKEPTGKFERLLPKRPGDEKRNKNASADCRSLPSRSAAESWEKTEGKAIAKGPLEEREYSIKNKIYQNPEQVVTVKSSPETSENKFEEVPEDLMESPRVKTPDSYVIESASGDIDSVRENESEEMADEKVKLTPRELASLVVTGTALNFDDIEIFEKPTEVNKIKLEIKIDVPSEEDVTDNETVEGQFSGNTSRASFDWLLLNKEQNEKQNHESFHGEYKTSKEKLASWQLLTEEFQTCEWKSNEKVFRNAHQSLSSVKRRPHLKKTVININGIEKQRGWKSDNLWSLSGDPYNGPMFFQSGKKRDAVSCTKVRSGLTRACNRDEKIFDDHTSLKLRRRNSEPYSLRGFIWKRADITSPKSLKPSVSSVASSLRHLNTDDLDDFIFWEAVPQKLTSCWEMSLYHFKRPWSVLSFSVFKDNRRSNTPGLILDTLRSGGMPTMRRPLLYQNDRVNCRTGNIFDVEPSISQKNIDIRNWLAALNFTTPIPNATDSISENIIAVPPVLDTKKQINPKRRNVMPQLKLPEKAPEKKLYNKVKNHKFDKWNISDMEDLKELIRKESGSFVTKEQYILSELCNLRPSGMTNTCTYMSTSEKSILKEMENQNRRKETRLVKSVETSCQAEPSETQEQLKLKETPDFSSSSLKSETASLPPEINIWKYLFLFTLMFIIFHYSLGSNFVIRS